MAEIAKRIRVKKQREQSLATCAICGEQMRVISWTHLMTHSVTRKEYMEEYELGPYKLISDSVRLKMARRSDFRPYSEEELYEAVKEIYAKYGDVSYPFFKEHYPQIAMQLIIVHGSWDKTLAQMGRRAKFFSRNRSWSREQVLQAIKALREKNGSLSVRRNAKQEEIVLTREARKQFGTWRKAVEAAGFDLRGSEVRLKWSKESLIEALKQYRFRKNIPEEMYTPINKACLRHFGGTEQALRAAGLEWEKFHGIRKWSKERVVSVLREYKKIYGKDCLSVLRTNELSLPIMAKTYVGSWVHALELAGIPSGRIAWTREMIIDGIRDALKDGKHTDAKYVKDRGGQNLYAAARAKFGSWAAAVEAAGYKHESLVESWDKPKIIEIIQALDKAGELGFVKVRDSNPKLISAATKYFGSWVNAKKAALQMN